MSTPHKSLHRRSRSLKTLFLPLSTRASVAHPVSTTQVVGSMPADIVLDIVDWLGPADVLSFSLCSSYTRNLLLPPLYTTLILKSSKKCRATLQMLLSRPDISKHIKKLALRPNYYLAWPKPDEWLDEEWVVGMVERIAGGGGLQGLVTFDWDGLEVPRDGVWRVLRENCPKLKSVFTNIGTRPLDPQSELFNFTDLTSFSLVVRHGLGGTDLFPPLEPLPPRLWSMLKASPNLEELALCSFSSSTRILDFGPLTGLKFAKLHTLTLGSFGYQSDFTLGPAELSPFLETHTHLEYVRFLWNFKRWMSPDTIPMSLSAGLPRLTTFIGVYQQLLEIPHPESIENVDLTCEPIYESRVEVLCRALGRLKGLRSLDIWTHVGEGDGGAGGGNGGEGVKGLLEGIGKACKGLEEWHFMCTTAFTSKPMSHLLATLPLLTKLTHFSLTKGHKYTDEPMLSTAVRIAKAQKGVRQVNIRWARERCPNHLKQEGSYEILPSGAIQLVERGIRFGGRSFERRAKIEGKLPPSPSHSLSLSSSSSSSSPSSSNSKGKAKAAENEIEVVQRVTGVDGDAGEGRDAGDGGERDRKRESVVRRIRSRGSRLLLKAASFSAGG